MKLNEEKICQYLPQKVSVRVYDSIDSTNNEAKRRSGAGQGIALYAASHQTAGRGRRGHSFYSPKDTGLYMTLSLPLEGALADVQKITCAAAVAVCETVTKLSGQRPAIKWVNDIYLNDKKAAGILTELLSDEKNQPYAVIIGIGLNLSTERFPAEFADQAGNLGDMDVNALCGGIADRLITLCTPFDNNSVMETYKTLSCCIGRTVTFERNGVPHTARAVDIDSDGGLVIEENGIRLTLNSGEISIKM